MASPLLLPLANFIFVVTAGQDVVGDGRYEAGTAPAKIPYPYP
jgi:hypothetical protein